MRPAQNYARQDSYDDRSAYMPTLNNTPRANGSSRPPPNYIPSRHNAASTSNRYSTRQAPIHRGATIRQQQTHQGPPSSNIPTYQNQGAPGLTSATTLRRGKTLTRPDRHVAPAPLINPTQVANPSFSNAPILAKLDKKSWFQPWAAFVTVSTFWAPAFVLDACGVKGKLVQRAWKEKVALCLIALVMGGVVAFFTIGLNRTLCPASSASSPEEIITAGQQAGYVGIAGWMFLANQSQPANDIDLKTYAAQFSGIDVTYFFDRSSGNAFPQCAGNSAPYATTNLCTNSSSTLNADCVFDAPTDSTFTRLNVFNSTKSVGWSWHDVANAQNHLAIDGSVLNLTPYLLAHPNGVSGDEIDTALRQVLLTQDPQYGKDATRLFHNRKNLQDALPCLRARYNAGKIDKTTPGCFAAQLFLYISLVVILGIILVRFFMACVFSWFLSHRLVQPPKNLRRQVVSPAVMPEGANIAYNNKTGTAPWTRQDAAKGKLNKSPPMNEKSSPRHLAAPGQREKKSVAPVDADGMISMAAIGAELFCVCLVTCYSEGEESIRSTLDSIAGTTYSDARKLLFVVCDGIVTGSGEKRSTPDICVSLVERDERFGSGEPQRMSYGAVGSGSKAHNEALVYAGHYTVVPGHRTPIIVVVKVGGPEEAHEKKPGNRGKRDGQMILMNFFGRVTYNDRMCPLDYDLFRKTHALMGVTPDFFEVCLMVDADTKVYPESLTALVNCMQHDDYIMGVCGETRIANKRQSWVTAIQVFEYFISHHLAKAFESVFGGVTCLPGCFSMYRIKARKANDSDWVPVLVQSEITKEYSQSDVQTLHQKNLLLLGEDRFLTTCLLRTFPNRKMMFCPQARCRTIAPDDFRTLLSQRRRWINSTIHNLMELVRVRNLCGTFCFSMQFIVFMELVGTVVLPVAICLTYSLIINYILNPPQNFADAIPLLLLAGVLGLPGVLILITTFKVVYLLWLLVYLVALPIWNFVLPVYAYWHFDDFSWGETRKVEGELKDLGHVGTGGTVEVNAVPFRRWDDWERSRLRKARRDQKRKKEFERAFGTTQHYPTESGPNSARNSAWDAETASLATSGEDDRYGYQIGQYSEDAASHIPPPVGLYATDDAFSVTVKSDQMVAMLEEEWNESDEEDNSREIMGQAVHYTQVQPDYVKTPPPGPRQIYNLSDNGTQSTYFADSNPNLMGNGNPYPSTMSSHSSVSFEEHAPLATGVETGYTHARNRSSGSPPNHHPQYQAR